MKPLIFLSSLFAALTSAAPPPPEKGIYIHIRTEHLAERGITFPVQYAVRTPTDECKAPISHPFPFPPILLSSSPSYLSQLYLLHTSLTPPPLPHSHIPRLRTLHRLRRRHPPLRALRCVRSPRRRRRHRAPRPLCQNSVAQNLHHRPPGARRYDLLRR